MDGFTVAFLFTVITVLLISVFCSDVLFPPSPEKQRAEMLAFFKNNYESTTEVTVTFTAEEMNDTSLVLHRLYSEYYDYQNSLPLPAPFLNLLTHPLARFILFH